MSEPDQTMRAASKGAGDWAVLIPERGRPDELGLTLDALVVALRFSAAAPTRVLVNGAPASAYAALQARHRWVEWHFVRRALGFHGAIAALLERSREDWVFLLNSDMRLHAEALARVLPWRAPEVFAVAAQILPQDRRRRREETGWTVPVRGPDGMFEVHDLPPPLEDGALGHVYAGGGASLFQTRFLRRFLAETRAYAPFYFEDADWGIRAWAAGLEVLHLPAALAVHSHRATIARHHRAARIAAIVARNLDHLRWRYGDLFGAPRHAGNGPARLRAALRGLRGEHRRARAAVLAGSAPDWSSLHHKRYPHPQRFRAGKPRLLLFTPFATLPANHGGARRVLELARAARDAVDCILLCDEAAAMGEAAIRDLAVFREVHAVDGRPAHGRDPAARLAAHAHPRLRCELARLIATRQPDWLCLEHLEAMELIAQLPAGLRIAWTLHDAGRLWPPAVQQRVRELLPRVHTLLLSTPADLGYWGHPRERLVENGVGLPAQTPPASDGKAPLLLQAPLRYAANHDGLAAFLTTAWPRLRAARPALRLRLLAGRDGAACWGKEPLPDGVELIEGYQDPADSHAACSLAINPQLEIEGSALKTAEALAHRRVMLSTTAGARGYEAIDCAALIRVPDPAAMVAPILALLADDASRHRAESTGPSAIAPWSWQHRASDWLAALL